MKIASTPIICDSDFWASSLCGRFLPQKSGLDHFNTLNRVEDMLIPTDTYFVGPMEQCLYYCTLHNGWN